MKIVVAGSRNLTEDLYALIMRGLTTCVTLVKGFKSHSEDDAVIILSGGATGIDKQGEDLADSLGLEVGSYLADWNTHGKAAGPIRNRQMAEACDAALVVMHGHSRGSQNMIEEARKRGKPVVAVYLPEDYNEKT